MSLLKLIEEKKKRKVKEARINASKNIAFGALAGIITGAVAGVLLAPKSGKETRSDISKKADNVKNSMNSNINKAKSKINEYLETKKNKRLKEKNIEVEGKDVQAEIYTEVASDI